MILKMLRFMLSKTWISMTINVIWFMMVMLGISFRSGILVVEGFLLFALLFLACLNFEAEEFGSYPILKKKLF